MIDYKVVLDDEQYLAVTSSVRGNKMVTASAGTGKTYTLTHRIAYLIEHNVKPENILLLTFTNKAASEMLDKTARLLKDEHIGTTASVKGGTFHSIALEFFYRYGSMMNVDTSSYTVISTEDAKDIISLKREAIVEEYKKMGIKASAVPTPAQTLGMISSAFNNNTTIDDVLNSRYRITPAGARAVRRMADAYKSYKEEHHFFDFDDLLDVFWKMLKDEKVRKVITRQYPYVLVDEVQDINIIQYDIIKMLEGNMFIVGDAKQAIYSFRGSRSEYIQDSTIYFTGYERFYLRHNYRSSQAVIDAANKFTDSFMPELEGKENLICTTGMTGHVHEKVYGTSKNEAEGICALVKSLPKNETTAILLRTNSASAKYESAFVENGISYRMMCGLPFFSRKHVRDITAFIKAIDSPDDEIAFSRTALLFPGIGTAVASKIYACWKAVNFSHDEFKNSTELVFNDRTREAVNAFTDIILAGMQAENIKSAISLFVRKFYNDYLVSTYPEISEYEDRKKDVDTLIDMTNEHKTAKELLSYITLMESGRKDDENKSNVIIITVHRAKGLEYDNVIIPELMQSVFPIDEKEEEEKNVFYVALTRAKKNIYLSRYTRGKGPGWGNSYPRKSVYDVFDVN